MEPSPGSLPGNYFAVNDFAKKPAEPDMAKRGGGKGSRTPDLLNAIQALYQLSYTPTKGQKRRGLYVMFFGVSTIIQPATFSG
jgi:hypothetical protein